MRRLGLLLLAAALASCGSDGPSADPELFCQRLDRLTTNDPFLAFGDTATPQEIEVAFEALVIRAEELVDVAPEEARPAAERYAQAVDRMQALMDAAGYDGARLDALAYRDEQEAYTEAGDRLLRHLESECDAAG